MFTEKMMKKVSFLVGIQATFMLMLLALFCTTTAAQTTGTIYGQVSDPSGAAVPEANITAENTATGLVRKGVSTPVGSYLVPSLPPGPYKVTVEHAGFKTYAQSGITVIVGENARVDAALEIGAVTQTVEVTASAIKVDTQSTTVGTTVDNLRVQAMPLNGRNVLALTQLLPGVGTADFPTQATLSVQGGIQIPVSGSRNTQNNMMLDGTSMVSLIYNQGTNLPSPDAIQEFRILTNTFSAEYGRASGGVFLAVTKSGTNDFHGSVFEYLRNDALNARNFFAASKPMLRQNQFGGSIGGPVRLPGYNGKDRTFFFFNYQGTRIRQQRLNTFYPPTQLERQGIFAAPIIDPDTGQPFPNNTIPPDRFDPLAKGMLDAYVLLLPNLPDGRNVTLLSQPLDGNDYTAKIDHQLSESNRFSFRFYRNDATRSNIEAGTAIGAGLAITGTNLVQTENLKYITIFSPRLLNEATFSHLRMKSVEVPGPGNKSPKELGGNFNFNTVPMAPWANVAGRFTVSSFWSYFGVTDTFYLSDKVRWMHGRHSVTAGTEIQPNTQSKYLIDVISAGNFLFLGAFTGNALADYLIGRPSSFGTLGLINNAARQENYHFFAQDDFKVNSRLTLNLGLRYEVNTPWWEVKGRSGTILPGQQSQRFPTAPPGLLYVGDPGVPPGLIPTDKNNFAPRIGFAWDPTGRGRTAIRAAFAVFTSYVGSIMSHAPNQVEPFLVPISTVPPSFSDPWDVAGGGIDPNPYVVNTENPTWVFPMQGFSIDPNFRDGYIEQWNFNIQHEFGPSVLVKAGYYGLVGHKLSHLREANQAVFGPGATAANTQQRRPFYPQYYGSIVETTSDANSNYHSLQVNADKKFSRGYTLQLAYTFSKSIDNRSRSQADGATCQDGNNCTKGDRGLSDFDQHHILAINGVWELPFMKGNRFLGGWQLAGLTRIASGIPFSALSGQDRALVGGGRGAGPQRLDLIGNWRLDPNRPHGELVAAYFDKSAFAVPEIGKFGNSGRNIIIGPGYSQTDLSLQKQFKLPGERGKIEFRADFFNLFNQVNFSDPVNTFVSPGFGRILAARDARIVQLALRFDF